MVNRRNTRMFRMLFLGAVTKSTKGFPKMPFYDGGEPPFLTEFHY